jgi:uncharacterized protein with LGFP repeats
MRRLTLGAAASAAVAALVVPSALASPESDAADAINQAWQAAGGANSVVGGKDGEVYPVGAGYGQEFSDGKIFFTPTAGAHVIYGPVLDKYESLGGPADSDLGFPNMDVVPGLVSSKSRVSTFDASDKPAIFWTAETGAWSVRGAINAAWDKLGGSAGQLGVPVEDERYDGDIVSQKFSGGQLSWNSKANTFTSDPPGLVDSLVGLDVPRDPVTMINLAWRASGGLGGPLGARQGELSLIGDTTAAHGYASGKVFYSPETGAHAVTGAILSKYESLGGPTGDLGLPAGPEADGGVPNSRISSFSAPDKPAIFWTPDTGAIVVRGPINAAWAKLGGATGDLGVPSGEQTAKGDTLSQTFTGGELSWNKATKEFSSKPAGLAAQLSGLEMSDAVAQTPAAPSSGGTADESGWRWWWLAIILPLLALLGLMAMLAQRKSRPQHEDVLADRGFFGNETEDDYWPGRRTETSTDSGRDFWSPPAADSAGLNSDEDAIDTAPTRIPSEADLAEAGYTEPLVDEWVAETPTSGRHSTSALGASPAAWRLELDETSAPRRRHAVEDSRTDELDVVVDEPVERIDYRGEFESEYLSEFQPELQPTYQSGRQGEYEPEFESRYQPSYQTEYQAEYQTDYQPDYEQRVDEGAEEPWRPAIHLPLSDPYQAPDGYWIKGNTHSGLYYTSDSVLYDNTIPEVWFASEAVAQANGFVRAPE